MLKYAIINELVCLYSLRQSYEESKMDLLAFLVWKALYPFPKPDSPVATAKRPDRFTGQGFQPFTLLIPLLETRISYSYAFKDVDDDDEFKSV